MFVLLMDIFKLLHRGIVHRFYIFCFETLVSYIKVKNIFVENELSLLTMKHFCWPFEPMSVQHFSKKINFSLLIDESSWKLFQGCFMLWTTSTTYNVIKKESFTSARIRMPYWIHAEKNYPHFLWLLWTLLRSLNTIKQLKKRYVCVCLCVCPCACVCVCLSVCHHDYCIYYYAAEVAIVPKLRVTVSWRVWQKRHF
jgi:hypothetical protein